METFNLDAEYTAEAIMRCAEAFTRQNFPRMKRATQTAARLAADEPELYAACHDAACAVSNVIGEMIAASRVMSDVRGMSVN
jgi:hypothetical protein